MYDYNNFNYNFITTHFSVFIYFREVKKNNFCKLTYMYIHDNIINYNLL